MAEIFDVYGSNYEMGFEIGRRFKPYLDGVMPFVEKCVQAHRQRLILTESRLADELPGCLEEIYGRADGAGFSREAMLLFMFTEYFEANCAPLKPTGMSAKRLPTSDGCTTVILKNNGRVLFAHNEDSVGFTADSVALVRYHYPDGIMLAYTMATRMTGSAFSVNSHGLVFSSNNIYDGKLNTDNISRYMALRDIIESKSIEEVRRKLRAIKVASPFALNVLDAKTHEVCTFEKDLEDVYEFEVADRFARANNFIFKKPDGFAPKSSVFRLQTSTEMLNEINKVGADIFDLVNILEYEGASFDTSIFEDREKYPDKLCTVATFAFDTACKTFDVYDRISKTKLTFDNIAK